jgi:flagellar hook-length control protein FliK
MKISDPQPPPSDANTNNDDVESSQSTENNDSSFSQMLAKKRGENQESTRTKGGKGGDSELEPSVAGFMQMPKTLDPSMQTGPVEGKHVVAMPPQLQQVVHEISVAVNAAGNQQVHIELNSNVMKGLHIRIERQDGAMAIQFQSTSDQVASLLSKNMDALSQGLADRGVNVADIRVQGPRESARVQGDKSRSNPGGRWQGGRQGGGR